MAAIHGALWEVPFLWEMGIGNPDMKSWGTLRGSKKSNMVAPKMAASKMAAPKMAAIHGALWEVPFLWEMGILNPDKKSWGTLRGSEKSKMAAAKMATFYGKRP